MRAYRDGDVAPLGRAHVALRKPVTVLHRQSSTSGYTLRYIHTHIYICFLVFGYLVGVDEDGGGGLLLPVEHGDSIRTANITRKQG
jgi:hypothetical protein